eukprot:Colp12_sorted_trinity150504_noHs@31486
MSTILLQYNDDRNCLIHMTEYFHFRNHLCISFELMNMNLYEFIKSNNFQGFSLGLIRRFAVQMLQCLKLLHKNKIIHCDLKPENVLLKHPSKSTIKVIDFGSSCFEHERVYTYIQSRFYRSPEVILGNPYSVAIDMWSFGCILAELYTGYPIFPGENEVEQLACIMELLGVPPKEVIEQSSRKKLFFDSNGQPRIVANSRGKKRRPNTKDLYTALKCTDHVFIHFLQRCLMWDPAQRMTPEEGLQHEWLAESARAFLQQPTLKSAATRSVGDIAKRKARASARASARVKKDDEKDKQQEPNSVLPPIQQDMSLTTQANAQANLVKRMDQLYVSKMQ